MGKASGCTYRCGMAGNFGEGQVCKPRLEMKGQGKLFNPPVVSLGLLPVEH